MEITVTGFSQLQGVEEEDGSLLLIDPLRPQKVGEDRESEMDEKLQAKTLAAQKDCMLGKCGKFAECCQ